VWLDVAADVSPIFGSWKEGVQRDAHPDAPNRNISLPEITKDLLHEVNGGEAG
jgi:hypothetical protein